MGAGRKLKRARSGTGAKSAPRSLPRLDRATLQKQSSKERFRTPGSETLWPALLGWDRDRMTRIRLADALHDGALWLAHSEAGGEPAFDPAGVVAAFEAQCPGRGARLDPDLARDVATQWHGHGALSRAPVFERLAALAGELGLGQTTAEAYATDWETWISPAEAAPMRKVLMDALAQCEQATMALHRVTGSDRVGSIVAALRLVWSGVAYGDERSLERVEQFAAGTLAVSPDAPEE